MTTQVFDSNGRLLTTDAIHQPQIVRNNWYVDNVNGAAGNDGMTPESAFASIAEGIAAAGEGDIIHVASGNYDEDGLDLAVDYTSLVGETGAVICNTATGTCLTLSGDYVNVKNIIVDQAGEIGFYVTGAHCTLKECNARSNTVGYEVTGSSVEIYDCCAGYYTVEGFDIKGDGCKIFDCIATGHNAAVVGFTVSGGVRNHLKRCESLANATNSFVIDTAANYTSIEDAISSAHCGPREDRGLFNTWVNFHGNLVNYPHEHVYPLALGEGVAVSAATISSQANDETNAATTAQWYYGEPTILIPRDTIGNHYQVLGIHIFTATANELCQFQIFMAKPAFTSARNGGNAWDEAEVDLTVDDGTLFMDQDLCLIYSDYAVEIVRVNGAPVGNVVTIEREASQFVGSNTGLRWNHTTNAPGTETLCVIHRESVRSMHAMWGNYITLAASIMNPRYWKRPINLPANSALLIRIVNQTSSSDVTWTAMPIYMG